MAHKNSSNWSPYNARRKSSSGGNRTSSSPMANSIRDARLSSPQMGTHRKSTDQFSFNQADDRIYDVFRHHGFADYPHPKRQQLTRFYELLMRAQDTQNITRLTAVRDVAIKHFVDCLMISRLVKIEGPLLDVGTGPGFPGIPLKIDQPDLRIILAEGVQKRVEFLKTVRADLQLPLLDISGRNINHTYFLPAQSVITRAVEDARNTLGNVVNCLQTGGRVYLMKGPNCDPEIQPALAKWGHLFELEQDIRYDLPNTPQARRLLVFRKHTAQPLVDLDTIEDFEWQNDRGAWD